MKAKLETSKIVLRTFFVTLVLLTYNPTSSLAKQCLNEKDLKITIFGEIHYTPGALKMNKTEYDKAEKGESLLLLEFINSQVNSNPSLKKEYLESDIKFVSEGHIQNIYGIDSMYTKALDTVGVVYIILYSIVKTNDLQTLKIDPDTKRKIKRGFMDKLVVEFSHIPVRKVIKSMEGSLSDTYVSGILNKGTRGLSDYLYNLLITDQYNFVKFLELLYEKASLKFAKIDSDVHVVDLSAYIADESKEILIDGNPFREKNMIREIVKYSCLGMNKNISVIVGQNHTENLKKGVTDQLKEAKVKIIRVPRE